MRIVEPSAELLAWTQLPPGREDDEASDMARLVEKAGRTSWKSEDKAGPGSAAGFCVRVVNIRKDESIAEHASATVRFVTDRYVSHQLVRARIAAYTQESTHYINYGKRGEDIEVCRPMGIEPGTEPYWTWLDAMNRCEAAYFAILKMGVKHYHARYALPGCLKTEVVATYNLRMWRHVLKQRTEACNTPEIVHVMRKAGHLVSQVCPEMLGEWALPDLEPGVRLTL